MPPARSLPYRVVVRKLLAAGFAATGQRGSHVKFIRDDGGRSRTVIVPRHRDVPVGTLRSILRQAGLSRDEFERL